MKTDEQLLEELERATEGLLFMSESDYPFQTVLWRGRAEVTSEYLRELTGQDNAPVEVVSVDDFFRAAASEPDWKGEQELALAKRYQALVRLLKEHLHDMKVYRVGGSDKAVYIVGRNSAENFVGISTRVVET
jgi:hypothetical protein